MGMVRKLAAIIAADVVGYSRLMGVDEAATLAALQTHRRDLIDPKIAEHQGRIVKTTGDGLLIEFPSVVEAVQCAVEFQRTMQDRNQHVPADRRIEFRVGINLGDIIIDDDDIYGDGVNVAARLENLTEANGICVSQAVHDQVRDKLDLAFEDLGERQLKNIARPVHVFQIAVPAIGLPSQSTKPALALPDKPSIAVLPFINMSGDPDQDYFADGMVEDIITALSRFTALFVIARNSSFTYKGRVIDAKQVGRELGVRYVLEGSVRKAASRVRITRQLIDTTTGAHLWANRIDGGLGDIFDLQDQVTESIVGAIAPAMEKAEIERAKRKPTESLDAYDYYLRGLARLYQFASRQANDEALRLFNRAIEIDPSFASAYGRAAYYSGWVKIWLGEPELAIERFARAVRLNPLDPRVSGMRSGTAHGYFSLGRYQEAASWAAMASRDNPDFQPALRIEAASSAMAGRLEQAHQALGRLRRFNPSLRVSNLKDALGPYRRAEDISQYQEALRRAGLPE